MSDPFEGKRYVVTGASSGFGEAYAQALHARGASVILVARRKNRLHKLSQKLNAVRSHSAEMFPADLSDESSSSGGLRELEEFLCEERVDGLINNAGFGSYGRFSDAATEVASAMIRVNVIAPLRLTKAVLPQMKQRNFGIIVHVASVAAFQPLPYMATYAATKSAICSLALSQHHELKSENIHVLAVCPGPVKTEFGQVAQFPGEFGGTIGDSIQSVIRDTIRGIERKKVLIFPGFAGKILGLSSRLCPPQISIPLLERLIRPK